MLSTMSASCVSAGSSRAVATIHFGRGYVHLDFGMPIGFTLLRARKKCKTVDEMTWTVGTPPSARSRRPPLSADQHPPPSDPKPSSGSRCRSTGNGLHLRRMLSWGEGGIIVSRRRVSKGHQREGGLGMYKRMDPWRRHGAGPLAWMMGDKAEWGAPGTQPAHTGSKPMVRDQRCFPLYRCVPPLVFRPSKRLDRRAPLKVSECSIPQ